MCGVTGETCASGDWRQPYANYLVKYIQDYESVGVNIDFVGFLNEPEFKLVSHTLPFGGANDLSGSATYDSMLSNGTQAASFIPILWETLRKSGLSTGVTCCDAEGWDDQVAWTKEIADAGAERYLSLITSHWYLSRGTSPINTYLKVWETEYADLNDPFSSIWYATGAFNEGLTWANLIYQGLVDCNLSAFLYWIGE